MKIKFPKIKYILPFMGLLLLIIPAARSNTTICTNTCPKPPFNIGNPVSRGFQQISGLNFLAAKFAELQIAKQLQKFAQGNVVVNVDSFSATDLAAGKLKGLEINASNVNLDDVYVSSIKAKSVCDFIHVDYNSKPVALLQPLDMKLNGVITQDDLNKTISSPKYLSRIENIKINNNGTSFIKLKSPKIALKNDGMVLAAGLWMSGTPANFVVPVEFNTGLKVNNGRIEFSDSKINTGFFKLNLSLPQSVYNAINPILYNLSNLDQSGSKLNFEKVVIDNGQINIEGSLWLPKTNKTNTIK